MWSTVQSPRFIIVHCTIQKSIFTVFPLKKLQCNAYKMQLVQQFLQTAMHSLLDHLTKKVNTEFVKKNQQQVFSHFIFFTSFQFFSLFIRGFSNPSKILEKRNESRTCHCVESIVVCTIIGLFIFENEAYNGDRKY